MDGSRRIALLLAIALHILLFVLLNKQIQVRPNQATGPSLTVRLLPFLQPKEPEPVLIVPLTQTPPVHQHAASTGISKTHPTSGSSASESLAPAISVPVTEAPKEGTAEGKSTFSDPAALVKSYSYENSKSDLQKAIESHGGNVALNKGKYDDFHEQMDFATTPDCMKPDALKHDPPKIGPIAIGGPAALLFLAHAVVTGKCQLPGAN